MSFSLGRVRSVCLSLCSLASLAAVTQAQAPVAEFSGTPISGGAPLSVSFTDFSSGTVSSWSWDFGDLGSSTLQNPGHTYTAAGTIAESGTPCRLDRSRAAILQFPLRDSSNSMNS